MDNKCFETVYKGNILILSLYLYDSWAGYRISFRILKTFLHILFGFGVAVKMF